MVPPKQLTVEDMGELIFDIIKVDPAVCLGVDLFTGRYDTKEIKLKPHIDPTPYLTLESNIPFKGHEVSVRKQRCNVTRVTFKNVPFIVPDEEILHLCNHYGKPVSDVKYEKMFNKAIKGCLGATRFVDMELDPGKQFENFYWMEGPLIGDKGARITVLHNQQVMQCSNCLRRADNCRGGGKGKACALLNVPRGKLAAYMQHLRTKIGYTSLKIQYQEKQQKEYPKLGGFGQEQDAFARIVESDGLDDDPEVESTSAKISLLSEFNVVQQQLKHKEQELLLAQKNSRLARSKLNHVKKVTEQRMLECLPDPKFKDDYSLHLANIWATCEDPDNYTVNEDADTIEPSDEAALLKDLRENCDMSVEQNKEVINFLKNKVIENVKEKVKKSRRRRDSSVCSVSSITSNSSKRKSEFGCLKTDSKSSRLTDAPKASSIHTSTMNPQKEENILTLALVNIRGQSGLNLSKQMQIQTFLQHNKIDILHLQETNILEDTFRNCNLISSSYNIIFNNSPSNYGTACLIKSDLETENLIYDAEGRVIIFDIGNLTFGNLYLPSGTFYLCNFYSRKY